MGCHDQDAFLGIIVEEASPRLRQCRACDVFIIIFGRDLISGVNPFPFSVCPLLSIFTEVVRYQKARFHRVKVQCPNQPLVHIDRFYGDDVVHILFNLPPGCSHFVRIERPDRILGDKPEAICRYHFFGSLASFAKRCHIFPFGVREGMEEIIYVVQVHDNSDTIFDRYPEWIAEQGGI